MNALGAPLYNPTIVWRQAMRVKVDPEVCIGAMSCEATCPAVFKVVGGVSTVIADPVPEDAEDAAREAVDNCPVEAISIVEE
jgi:ferredoxin